MCNRSFNLIRTFLKICIICSTLGEIRGMDEISCSEFQKETPCNERDILNNLQFIPIPTKDNDTSLYGIVKANFTLPHWPCTQTLQLLVDESVTEDACKNYTFTTYFFEHLIHSRVILNTSNDVVKNTSSCQIPKSYTFYHVFSGCYTLMYTYNITNKVIANGKPQYITTSYKKSDLWARNVTCNYKIYQKCSKICCSDEYTEIVVGVLFPPDIRGWTFEVNLSNTRKRNCTFQLDPPMPSPLKYSIAVDNLSSDKYCTRSKKSLNNSLGINCIFPICAPQNTSYNVTLNFNDFRKIQYGIWHPKDVGITYTNGTRFIEIDGPKDKCFQREPIDGTSDHTFKWTWVVSGVSFLILVVGFTMFVRVCRLRNNNVIESHGTDTNERRRAINKDTNVGGTNNLIPMDNKSNGIILLYVKSSPPFLALMTSFRTILKRCCHCDVYDWYDDNECCNVATLGPLDWVDEKLTMGCRIVWVDTIFSRSLVLSHGENHEDTSMISDFRDDAFPVILDIAKRNIKDPASQYQNHFIIRFDTFLVDDSAEDPFANISPHVRYLMPRHIDQLCFDLSKQSFVVDDDTSNDIGTTSEVQQELQCLMSTLQSI